MTAGRKTPRSSAAEASERRQDYPTWRKSLWCGLGAVITLALAATNDGRLW